FNSKGPTEQSQGQPSPTAAAQAVQQTFTSRPPEHLSQSESLPRHTAIQNLRGFTQRPPYRLSERRVTRHSSTYSSNSSRMTYRQPLDTLPLEHYNIHPSRQNQGDLRNNTGQNYLGHYTQIQFDSPIRAASVSRNDVPAAGVLHLARLGLQTSQVPENTDSPLSLGLMTFRVEPNGNSAVVIRHSEGYFQPGEVIESQAGLASCFESRVCPICQEEWIWRGFTPAEIAILDSSGAEWEVARLPCGHAFHSACLAVWFHEGSPSCPCCRREYRFREYRWSELFCYEGWRLRYNWQGDREASSADAYLDGHPHYPSISRRVSFTIRSQSEEQPRVTYTSDPTQASPLPSQRRRHPSWTTLSSSGGGTVLRRTRRTSRYVSDTLNALGEASMAVSPEEPANGSMTDFCLGDLQALTPDMILHEPEYWSRYEIEIGEEGEGSRMQICPNDGISLNGLIPGWPHFDAYISPSLVEQARIITRLGDAEAGEEREISPNNNNQEFECFNTQMHVSHSPLSEILRQWNTRSTVGDVLRDFHVILAYVLEGMQRYEAGMAPWPGVSPNFDQSTRDLCQEDIEGNISITSASRRVLSLLESTGIPGASRSENPALECVTRRISKIPRLVKKDLSAEAQAEKMMMASEDAMFDDQEIVDQAAAYCQVSQLTSSAIDAEKTKSPRKVASLTIPGQRESVPVKDVWASKALGGNRGASSSCSPEKMEDPSPRTIELGHVASKIPVLLSRPGGGHSLNPNVERMGRSPVHKGVENSPLNSQRGRLMAGEMKVPLDLHFMRGRKPTRDYSPLAKNPIFGITSPKKDNTVSDFEKDETDDELNEKKRSRFT
ncbi:hypothetical protein DFP73DRAFT_250078, partial [Morchella snyderi]